MDKRNISLIILCIAIAISVIFIWFTFVRNTPMTISSSSIRDILKEYVYAIAYLNRSSYALKNVSRGMDYIAPSRDEIVSIVENLQQYSIGLYLPPGSLGELLARSAETYLYISNASIDIVDSLSDIDTTIPIMREILVDVRSCNIDEALSKYFQINRTVIGVIYRLSESYLYLSNVDREKLLSKNHSIIVENSRNIVRSVLDSYNNFEKIMRLVATYRDLLNTLCSIRKNSSIDIETINTLLNRPDIQSSINECRASINSIEAKGVLSRDIAQTRNFIEELLKRYSQNQQQGSGPSGIGGGAGYVPPESDD
ncbi:hypothetical protein Igag_0977 [Ignisphaera aggregans DSM 17230]|uniref:Uncharacterized protein n=1 Tax=Ignisphaera aggregans (strain DSM 17230 / JCM 13409 / AQ1.S1) TaxID=583356 RepID=E0SNJ6_IGNAA|nr:hypothetical protein Igag_0977 [Ignisphaera aggregans DSM 17230]